MVELLAHRERLDPFANFHMSGHWDEDGTQVAAAIQRVLTRRVVRTPKTRQFLWWLIRLASLFVATLRELLEMRYLWPQPVRMNNTRLVAVLGREPHTALDEAIEATLLGLGCLG
jgi:nucleoside-diphosphate-sugar epimerase